MARHWLAGCVLVAAVASASAGESADGPVRFWAQARVLVDEGGVPKRVEPSAGLAGPIGALVEQRVLGWRFEPAIVDGTARPGTTHVFLDGCATPLGDGTFDVALQFNGNGPGSADGERRLRPPSYPREALRYGREGIFRVVIKSGVDGRAELESIKSIQGDVRLFRKTLSTWAPSLRFVPEEVDGAPVATRTEVLVDFLLDRRGRATAEPASCEAFFHGVAEDRVVTLDSPFRPLATD